MQFLFPDENPEPYEARLGITDSRFWGGGYSYGSGPATGGSSGVWDPRMAITPSQQSYVSQQVSPWEVTGTRLLATAEPPAEEKKGSLLPLSLLFLALEAF